MSSAERVIDIELLPHQRELLLDVVSPYPVLEGGLGSGKTTALLVKAIQLARENPPGVAGCIVEPTSDLIGSILLPSIEKLFTSWRIDYEYRTKWQGRPSVLLLWPRSSWQTVIYLRSGDKPMRITGFDCGWWLLDEHDQQKPEVFARLEGRRRDRRAFISQGCSFGTPEPGFGWTYNVFHGPNAIKGVNCIVGVSTKANIFNRDDYAESLAATHPEDAERVLSGRRMNRTGLVYSAFKAEHKRHCANRLEGRLVVGADFNVGKMHWVFGREIGDELHIWGELVQANTNTFEQTDEALRILCALLRDPYGRESERHLVARRFRVYADPSGGSRRTSASESDLAIMARAGFVVEDWGRAPPIEDRVATVQDRLRKGKLYVDPQGAPELVRCLETQGYAQDGRPDKDPNKALDAGPDALGYIVWGHVEWRLEVPRGNSRRWA